jgi:hypothetical protein
MTNYTNKTEKEVKEAKAKAILALKFAQVKQGSLAYYIALGDAEALTKEGE